MISRLRSATATPVALGVFFLAVYLLTGSSDLNHNGDTDLRFQTTQAIVDHARLWIDHPRWLDTRVAVGRGGHLYAFYAPGQTVMMIPLYIAGKAIAHHLNQPYDITTLYAARSLDLFLGAGLAVAFFAFSLAAGYSRRVAATLTLVLGLASVVWPDAQSALEQTPVDLFVLVAALAAWMFVKGGMSGRRWLLLAGGALGLAACTRYDAVIFVPAIALYLTFMRLRAGSVRSAGMDMAGYAVALLPFAVLLGIWDWARFGSPFLTGLHEQTFGGPYLQDLAGLTVSPGKGLLWYLPLILVSPWAAAPFFRRCPQLASLCGIMVLVPVLFYSAIKYWHGDPSWGPRYLFVAVPYLVLPLGEVLRSWGRVRVPIRLLFVACVASGVILNIAALSVTQWRFWYRLEVQAESRVNPATWSGQPFHWGAQHYHYYWNLSQSPILIQLDNVSQVARLTLGDTSYRYTARPDPYVSNPAENYPINSFAFWWTDTMHPLLGAGDREGLAALLMLLSLAALGVTLVSLEAPTGARSRPREDSVSTFAGTLRS